MNKYPITVFVLLSPEKDCLSAYVSSTEANKILNERIARFGYGYSLEPVSLTVTKAFYERLKHIFAPPIQEKDVVEVIEE